MQSYIRPVVTRHGRLAIMGIRALGATLGRATSVVNRFIGLVQRRSDRSRHDPQFLLRISAVGR